MKKNTLALIALCSAVFSAGLSAAGIPEHSTFTFTPNSVVTNYRNFFDKDTVAGKTASDLATAAAGANGGVAVTGDVVFEVYGISPPQESGGRNPQMTDFEYTTDASAGTGVIALGGAISFEGGAAIGDFILKPDPASSDWSVVSNISFASPTYVLTNVFSTIAGGNLTLGGDVKYTAGAAGFLGSNATDVIGTFKFTTIEPPVIVPDVVGQLGTTAATALSDLGFTVTSSSTSSTTVAASNVISQDPAAGAEVIARSEVTLVISTGPAPVDAPDVIGQTEAAAIAAFVNAGFTATPTITKQAHATIVAGLVIGQTPAPTTSVAPSIAVALVVSTGPVPVDVPNVVGETQTSATATLTDAGLTVGTVTEVVSNTIAAGVVISQTPVVATSVAPSSAVNLVVSSGFDGNNDNTPDSTQDDVAEVATGAEAITLDVSASGCTTLDSAVVSTAPSDSMASPVTDAIDFKLSGCGATANIDVYFYGLTKTPTKIRKYGKTAASAGADVWYDMAGTITAVTVNGLDAYKASYTVTDNGLGDNDPAAGVIADPVMLAAPLAPAGAVKPIPTLSFWGLLALSALMPGMVSFMSRRKSRK